MLEGATLKGRYRLDRLIGGDGRRGVFQATDLHAPRDIAVKVVAFAPGATREDAAVRDRFRDHAATAARLRHPNVATVHEVGTDEPLGLDFVVMELLRGEDLQRPPNGEAFSRELDAILRDGPPPGAPARVDPGPWVPVAPAAPAAAPADPLPAAASTAPSVPTPDRRRDRRALALGGGTVALVAVLSIAASALRREQAAEYFAGALPIAPARADTSGEIGYIREVYRRIENGGPGVREWRMELGRFPSFEWPSSDSAHATVYQDGDRLQKIRVRVYEHGARTALLFYYDDAGALVFVHQVTPSGGGRDAEQRFYFRDRALIRWRDTRNEIVPLGSGGHNELARMFLRISDRLLELEARAAR